MLQLMMIIYCQINQLLSSCYVTNVANFSGGLKALSFDKLAPSSFIGADNNAHILIQRSRILEIYKRK
jgi:hypothetical protein